MVLAADAHVADLFSCGRGQELEKGLQVDARYIDTNDGLEIRQAHQLRLVGSLSYYVQGFSTIPAI